MSLPRESHGQRSLVGYSPWGSQESDNDLETKPHLVHYAWFLWMLAGWFTNRQSRNLNFSFAEIWYLAFSFWNVNLETGKCFKGWKCFKVCAYIRQARDFPRGPEAKFLCSQSRGPGFNPWPGNCIPYATTKSSHPTCNKDWRSCYS